MNQRYKYLEVIYTDSQIFSNVPFLNWEFVFLTDHQVNWSETDFRAFLVLYLKCELVISIWSGRLPVLSTTKLNFVRIYLQRKIVNIKDVIEWKARTLLRDCLFKHRVTVFNLLNHNINREIYKCLMWYQTLNRMLFFSISVHISSVLSSLT